METEPQRKGRINYSEQGFIVHWDGLGLQIQVTDYYAKSLRLFWKDILSLARVAGPTSKTEGIDQ